MRILMAASECFPLIKTGGLADVVGALPLSLAKHGLDVSVFLPGFPSVIEGLRDVVKVKKLSRHAGQILRGTSDTGLDVLVLDIPGFFNFDGHPYLDANGKDRDGMARIYATFAWYAANLAAGDLVKGFRADILHAHDWQAAMACAYVRSRRLDVRTICTIHNLAFQGLFPMEGWENYGLPDAYREQDGLEYWGQISFLKAGIVYSDHVTTVSPTYALEIQSDAGGMGFGGLLKSRSADLSGILNGIDLDVWNPETDTDIAANFSARSLSGKAKNKAALQKKMGLRRAKDVPLFCVISRLTTQKGLDVLAELVDHIVLSGGQLALLGSGDAAIEDAFIAAGKKHPTEVGMQIGYDEPLAHLMQAGSDAIFIPSRFEPCGLTQLCAMRYGTIPIAGRVGGLNDTIIDASPAALAKDAATGLLFQDIDTHNLSATIDRAFALYGSPETWAKMRQNAIKHPVGWELSAKAYMSLYESLVSTA